MVYSFDREDNIALEQAQRVGELPESIPAASKIIEKLQEDTEQYKSFLTSISQQVVCS